MKNIAIIGAGASGLVAAITVARAGASVSLFEQNKKVGRKILATGNGRCNITNRFVEPSRFHGKNPNFVNPAITFFNEKKCESFFHELGVLFIEGNENRLYPMSLQASSVVDLLAYECKRVGVKTHLESKVESVKKNGEKLSIRVNGKNHLFDRVLVTTGGLAMPSLGSCESGYSIAKSFGHKIVPTFASLVQLESKESFVKDVSGVKFEGDVSLYVDNELVQDRCGDVLFTNYGISGSAVLDVSRKAALGLYLKKDVVLKVDLMPNLSKEALRNLLKNRLKITKQKSIELWLDGLINKKLANLVVKLSNLRKNSDELTQKDIGRLVYTMKEIVLHVKATKGFKSAEVTAGGVDVNEVDSKTFESKKVKGLFFAGEVLDIDADCGGFNLHWAWASGIMAAKGMSK